MNSGKDSDSMDIEDPITESFPVMVEAAKRYCHPGATEGDVCFAYHRLWPYRRLLSTHGGALNHAYHFVKEFRTFAASGISNRVLISGNADYGLLAQVLYAFRAEGVEPDVTVLDLCRAPLAINEWYAQRHAARIETVCADITQFSCEEPFGIITTDHFLVRIAPAQRALLLPKWHSLLVNGGKVITTEAARKEDQDLQLEQEALQSRNRVARFVSRIDDEDLSVLGATREQMAQYAGEYYQARSSYPLGSAEELRALFEENGFAIDEFSPARERKIKRHYRPTRRYSLVATRIS